MDDHFAKMDLAKVPTGTLARVLATTDGTIATILEAYVDEPVRVVKLSEVFESGSARDGELAVDPGERCLRRTVLLHGGRSDRNYLYAECVIRADRLPEGVLDELVDTDTPLRRILTERRVGTSEEMISGGREPAGDCARHFGVGPGADMICRSYRIMIGGVPVILISEKFPAERFS